MAAKYTDLFGFLFIAIRFWPHVLACFYSSECHNMATLLALECPRLKNRLKNDHKSNNLAKLSLLATDNNHPHKLSIKECHYNTRFNSDRHQLKEWVNVIFH